MCTAGAAAHACSCFHSACVWCPQIWSSERGRCHSLDILRRLQKAWAERQFRLVNFILSVPYQAPLPDRARRPPSRRYHPPKQEYISKDSGTFVLAGECCMNSGAQSH